MSEFFQIKASFCLWGCFWRWMKSSASKHRNEFIWTLKEMRFRRIKKNDVRKLPAGRKALCIQEPKQAWIQRLFLWTEKNGWHIRVWLNFSRILFHKVLTGKGKGCRVQKYQKQFKREMCWFRTVFAFLKEFYFIFCFVSETFQFYFPHQVCDADWLICSFHLSSASLVR